MDVCTCFVNLEKAYDRVPREKLLEVLREYGVDGRLLLCVKSLYSCSEVCILVGGVKSQPLTVGVGLRQGCVLSSLLFIVYMNWIESQPSRRRCHSWELQDQPFTFCRRFGTASIFSTGSSACTGSVFCCVWPSRNEK